MSTTYSRQSPVAGFLPVPMMLVNFLFRRTASYTIIRGGSFLFFDRSYAKFSLAPSCPNTEQSRLHPEHSNLEEVSLNSLFWWKSCSLALPPDSRMRVEEPHFEGIKYVMLKMMLFYSKQSKYIRGANVVYRRIKYQFFAWRKHSKIPLHCLCFTCGFSYVV